MASTGTSWNSVSVTPSGGTAETWNDAASIAAHFESRTNLSILSDSPTEALLSAQHLVGRYADSSSRIPRVDVIGARDPDTWPVILSARNGDRLTWVRTTEVNVIEMDVFVERVADTIVPGVSWNVAFELSPAADQSGWILGDETYSVLGETTVLVY